MGQQTDTESPPKERQVPVKVSNLESTGKRTY